MTLGIRSALRKIFQEAIKDPKFNKVFDATPMNGGGSRAYQNKDIRVDHGEPNTGNRVVQIQAETSNPTLKRFSQQNGTHAKVAVVQVNEGGPPDAAKFYEDVISQA